MKSFPQYSRCFPGVQGNNNFPGVFQGPGRELQNSRSFPGIPGACAVLTMHVSRQTPRLSDNILEAQKTSQLFGFFLARTTFGFKEISF